MPDADTQTVENQEPAAPPAPEIPDLDPEVIAAILDRYAEDPDKRAALAPRLRTNRFVAGIVGEVTQRDREARDLDAAKKAVSDEKDRLRRLRHDDPLAYAEEMETKESLDDARQQLAETEDRIRRGYIERIGTALRDLPEARELTPEEHAQLAQSLAGVAEDDVLPVFQKFFTDLVATKRGGKMAEQTIAARLAAERKVWEKEQADKRLKDRQSPSAGSPPQGNARDTGEPDWKADPVAWETWYDKKRRAGTLVRAR